MGVVRVTVRASAVWPWLRTRRPRSGAGSSPTPSSIPGSTTRAGCPRLVWCWWEENRVVPAQSCCQRVVLRLDLVPPALVVPLPPALVPLPPVLALNMTLCKWQINMISIQFNSLFLVNHLQPSMFYPACRQCPHNRGPGFTIHNSIQQSPRIQSSGLCEEIAWSEYREIWARMWSLCWKQKWCKNNTILHYWIALLH